MYYRVATAMWQVFFGQRSHAKRVKVKISIALLLLSSLLPYLVQFYDCSLVLAESGVVEKQKALTFLAQVAGINMSSPNVLSCNVFKFKIPDSNHNQTDISVAVKNGNYTLNILVTFIDGKLWTYDVDPGSNRLAGKKTLTDCLFVTKGAIEEYGRLFNAVYCSGLKDMISAALQNQVLTVEDNISLLKTSYVETCSTLLDYRRCTNLQWFKKINNRFADGSQSISMSVSKSGLLTMFVDNLAVFYLSSTDIRISEEEALNITMPYAEAYSAEHGQKIVSANATLEWHRDLDSSRGDDFAIYPRWLVSVTFDSVNEHRVFAYRASIWADSGQIASKGPQTLFGANTMASRDNGKALLWLIFAAIIAFPVLICLATYSKNRSKK